MELRVTNPHQRRIEIALVVLFICTAVVGLAGGLVWAPLFEPSNHLPMLVALQSEALGGSLLWGLGSVSLVFTAIFAHHYLKVSSPSSAIGFLVIRCLEASVIMVGIIAVLLLVFLCQSLVSLGPGSENWTSGMAILLKQVVVLSFSWISLPLHGIGGLLLTGHLLRLRMVPVVIAVWGFLGYLLCMVGGIGIWFGAIELSTGVHSFVLLLPVTLFEMVLFPVWLLFRGVSWEPGEGAEREL